MKRFRKRVEKIHDASIAADLTVQAFLDMSILDMTTKILFISIKKMKLWKFGKIIFKLINAEILYRNFGILND